MNTAIFSPCRTWRYSLIRELANPTGGGTCVFVGLNPSTADETKDDPTIRRCIRFASDWGFERLEMVNLYAFRATNPNDMFAAADPVGPDNDRQLSWSFFHASLIVAAWGANAREDRVKRVTEYQLWTMDCLGLTKHGAPRHPLYVPAITQPRPFIV